MSLFALILSACVGAVNLPAGTIAEAKTEKTDETLDQKSIVIDDKEPEPIAVDDKEPEEQIVIDRQPENPCIANPFKPTCGAGFASARAIVISKCIVGNMAQADPTCGQAVAGTNNCITDPFLSGCEANPFFNEHVIDARDERVRFCNNAVNEKDSLCTGSDSVKDICDYHPFSRVCGYNHETARTNRAEFCSDSTNAENNLCMLIKPCDINPFGAGCFSDAVYKIFRNKHIIFCSTRANAINDACKDTLSTPNVASFLQAFEKPLLTLPSTSNGNVTGNAFLQGIPDGLDSGDTRPLGYNTLNLSSGDGTQNLGGDAADGVAFYYAYNSNLIRQLVYSSNTAYPFYYAGIFSNTDLGASIAKKSGTAEWKGTFISIGDGATNSPNFTLTINFGAGDQAGTIAASIGGYSLTGDFDNSGVIRGDVIISRRNEQSFGTLRGLIGQEGAVGVFINNHSINRDALLFAGGFVVRPPSE